mmetsp:Transcript_48618/g.145189  ORF Transcript_48618/g.145189 Transcript_48618/m.145189 type:complete len:150 (-) Transcript_48618:48-497(-)
MRRRVAAKAAWVHDASVDFTHTQLWHRGRRFVRRHMAAECFGVGALVGGAALLVTPGEQAEGKLPPAEAARVAFEARRRRGKVLHPPVQAPPRPEQKRSRSIGRAQRSCHGGGADEAAGTTWCSSGSEADTEEPCEFVPVDSHHLENLD